MIVSGFSFSKLFHLGKKEDQTRKLTFYTEEEFCDCNQNKLLYIRECRIKDAGVRSHFCTSGVKYQEETGQTCIDQCSKYFLKCTVT